MRFSSRYPLWRIRTLGITGWKRNKTGTERVKLLLQPASGRLYPIRFRPMTEQDIPKVAALERNCFSQPWSERVLLTERMNPNAVFYVAANGERVLGYAGMHRVLDEGYIANVAVGAGMRRRGVAGELMNRLFYFARENRLGFLTLEVRESNLPAMAFYHKLGFGEVGRRKRFYANPTEDAILMTTFLTAEER